jgi:GNAT superfamily N-acetyltransferase
MGRSADASTDAMPAPFSHHHHIGRTTMNTTTTNPTIRRASSADTATVAATVAAGFFDDPVTCWLLPDVDRRRQIIQPMFELYVEPYLTHGETYLTDDHHGAAVWLPPAAELLTAEQEAAFGEALAELVGPAAARCFALAEIFAEHHPDEPLYYCQFLSTVPAFQSRGIGSAFLHEVLQRADAEQVPAYHEATSPRNRALYERHGYVSQGEFRLPDGGPTLWRMWREPR